MTLNQFIERRYLPFVLEHKEPSTYAGYRNMFKLHVRKYGDVPLRDFPTCEIEQMLTEIAREFDTARTTIQHVKSFLSGAFRYAKRHGWHAFRRGMATNLHRLGVADKVIQAILRHANVAVTQRCYIQTSSPDAVLAMRRLEYATTMQLESRTSKQERSQTSA